MKIEKSRLDSKGRVLIPKTFRESLGIEQDDIVFISLDEKNRSIVVSQYSEKDVYQILVEMGDKPGSLAKMASVLSKNKVDLITTESHSILRTKKALWRVLCSLKRENKQKLKKELIENGAKEVQISKI